MSELFARTLTTKSVVGYDGVEFGSVHNITLHPLSGELDDLVVEPTRRFRSSSVDFETDENGRLLVPFDRVQVVKDSVIVDY